MEFTFVADAIDLSNKDLIVSLLLSTAIALVVAIQQAHNPFRGGRFRNTAFTILLGGFTALALFFLSLFLLDRLFRITNPGIILDFDNVFFTFYIPPALYIACFIYLSSKRREDEPSDGKRHKFERLNLTYVLFAGLAIYAFAMASDRISWFKSGKNNTQWIAQKNSSGMQSNNSTGGKDIPDEIDISSPQIISSSSYDVDHDGRKETIEILLSKGKVINHEDPWCGEGKRWVGEFIIRVSKEGRFLSTYPLNKYMGEGTGEDLELSFWAPEFALVFKDYNGDGNIDFNLGQYGGCDGNIYWLFTIKQNGTIEPLPFEGSSRGIFIQNSFHVNSTDAIQLEDNLIIRSFYNRDEEIEYIEWHKWNGEYFAVVKHKEISNRVQSQRSRE